MIILRSAHLNLLPQNILVIGKSAKKKNAQGKKENCVKAIYFHQLFPF